MRLDKFFGKYACFASMPIFVVLFILSGFVLNLQNVHNAWYQISPAVIIVPSIVWAFITTSGTSREKVNLFIDGARENSTMEVIGIFVLSGVFGFVTEKSGAMQSCIDIALSHLSGNLIVPGIFLVGAFISTAIGSSMGAIAAIMPLAVNIGKSTGIPMSLMAGTVISGSMFGDNLSMVSDTTIASVNSVSADLGRKFKLNAKIALPASVITILILYRLSSGSYFDTSAYHSTLWDYVNIIPYLLIVAIAFTGIHVFLVLGIGIASTGIIGVGFSDYHFLQFTKDMFTGSNQLWEVSLIMMQISGINHIVSTHIAKFKSTVIPDKAGSKLKAEILLLLKIAFADICLANNTLAIIIGGKSAKDMVKINKLDKNKAATIMDVSSCIVQGVIPHGAQIILACGLASGTTIWSISESVVYCYILLGCMLSYLFLSNIRSR